MSAAMHHFQGMRQNIQNHFKALNHRLGASRKANDESAAERARETAREHRHGSLAPTIGPQELAVAGNLALEERPDRLRGDVPGTETGAPGRDHQLSFTSPGAYEGCYRSLLIRDDFAGHDFEAQFLELRAGESPGATPRAGSASRRWFARSGLFGDRPGPLER